MCAITAVHLILRAEVADSAPVRLILDLLAHPHFRAVIGELGRYDTTHTGEERTPD
jgi:hypothetical protein